LRESIPFYEKDQAGNPLETASVLGHLKRALAFTRGDIGKHGLPLLGFADWNDTINLRAGAESLFSAHLYGRALNEMIGLLEYINDPSVAEYRAAYDEMKVKVEKHA